MPYDGHDRPTLLDVLVCLLHNPKHTHQLYRMGRSLHQRYQIWQQGIHLFVLLAFRSGSFRPNSASLGPFPKIKVRWDNKQYNLLRPCVRQFPRAKRHCILHKQVDRQYSPLGS